MSRNSPNCSLHYAASLALRSLSPLPRVMRCVLFLPIKWTWKGIRFIIYGMFLVTFPFSPVLCHSPLLGDFLVTRYFNIINALACPSPPSSCCLLFAFHSCFALYLPSAIKFICSTMLIYGNVYNSPKIGWQAAAAREKTEGDRSTVLRFNGPSMSRERKSDD